MKRIVLAAIIGMSLVSGAAWADCSDRCERHYDLCDDRCSEMQAAAWGGLANDLGRVLGGGQPTNMGAQYMNASAACIKRCGVERADCMDSCNDY